MPRGPRVIMAALATLTALFVGCIGNAPSSPTSEVCGGVPADMGGCDPDQPTFDAGTCEAAARQFGREIDTRLTTVIDEPAEVDGNGRSVRALYAVILTAARLNQHLRSEGLVDDCDAEGVMAVAEDEFSSELRARAGSLVSEVEIHDYEDWYDLVLGELAVIDQDEHLP